MSNNFDIQHIAKAIDWLIYEGIVKNRRELAEKMGYKESSLSQIMTGKVALSERFIKKLYNFDNRLNLDWLLRGEGEMVNPSVCREETPVQISTGRVIPYFDAEVAAGTCYGMEMTQTEPVGMIEIGGLLKDSEFALRVYGNSMTPNYPAGCVVGLRQHLDSFIEPGTVYVVETADNRYLKRLYNTRDRSAFRCISDNHMKHESGPMAGEYFYPEFEIPLTDIRRLLRVTGVVKRNIL